jgi:hypothetical protein
MTAETESLGELYQQITGESVVTESQGEEPSRDPIEETDADLERDVQAVTRNDGLGEAVEGGESAEQIA